METNEFKLLKSELKNIFRDVEALLKIDIKTFKDMQTFEDKLIKSALGTDMGQAFEDWKSRARQLVGRTRSESREEFGRYVTEFVRTRQEAGVKTRDFQKAWRLGPLKMELKPDQASVRFLYNDQILCGWTAITSSSDIDKLCGYALKQLEDHAIPNELLVELLEAAIEMAKFQMKPSPASESTHVPIKEFFFETEMMLIRRNKLHKGKYKVQNLPLWAFLYNVDRYRSMLKDLPIEKRLQFDHGSQQEIGKGMGLTLNGLDASEDYKTFCFVKTN